MSDQARHRLAKELFLAALELPAAQREAFVRSRAADAAMADELLLRLAAERPGAGSELLAGMREVAVTAAAATTTATPRQIGPYRILAEIGRGGMGIVYKAGQREPVQRLVAIKVVRGRSEHVKSRFDLERRTLAAMSHSGIARIFDAGSTAEGEPYFVMELIDGERLTTWCDERRLSLDERLRLFQRICDAVQHAHNKGVVHRDLKPDNILVVAEGDHGAPKILDFGLAKLVDAASAGAGGHSTHEGLGTLEYMSPEQVDGDASAMDVRTDVYALGVILYQLLAEGLPFPSERLRRVGPFAALQILREEEPPPPSVRLREHACRDEVASNRATTTSALLRALSGDLDRVVQKAMAKEPDRRYGSPAELAQDVGRYLSQRPVLATPTTGLYRLRKFVRRHRGMVAAATGVALALAIGSALYVRGLREAALTSALGEARVAFTQGRWQQALEAGDRAVALGCADPAEIRCDQVECLEALLRVDDSLALLHSIPPGPPSRAEARRLMLLGSIGMDRMADPSRGIDELQAAWKLHSDSLSSTGVGLLSPGDEGYLRAMLASDLTTMIAALRAGAAAEPWHRMVNQQLPALLLLAGHAAEAAAACRASLARWPRDDANELFLLFADALQRDRSDATSGDEDEDRDPVPHAVRGLVDFVRSAVLTLAEDQWQDNWHPDDSFAARLSRFSLLAMRLVEVIPHLSTVLKKGSKSVPPALARAYQPIAAQLARGPTFWSTWGSDLQDESARGGEILASLVPSISDSMLFYTRAWLRMCGPPGDRPPAEFWQRIDDDLALAEGAVGPIGSLEETQRLVRVMRIRALATLAYHARGEQQATAVEHVVEVAQRALRGGSMAPEEALLFASVVIQATHKHELPVQILERAWRDHPDDAYTMVMLGRYERNAGDTAAAERWFRKALACDPTREETQNELRQLEAHPADATSTRPDRDK